MLILGTPRYCSLPLPSAVTKAAWRSQKLDCQIYIKESARFDSSAVRPPPNIIDGGD
jgi:hypothetical protein